MIGGIVVTVVVVMFYIWAVDILDDFKCYMIAKKGLEERDGYNTPVGVKERREGIIKRTVMLVILSTIMAFWISLSYRAYRKDMPKMVFEEYKVGETKDGNVKYIVVKTDSGSYEFINLNKKLKKQIKGEYIKYGYVEYKMYYGLGWSFFESFEQTLEEKE